MNKESRPCPQLWVAAWPNVTVTFPPALENPTGCTQLSCSDQEYHHHHHRARRERTTPVAAMRSELERTRKHMRTFSLGLV